MEPTKLTTSDLLEAWRDAVRAAELAERMASNAVKAAEDADTRALASTELAALAELAAEHATRTASSARATAELGTAIARALRAEAVPEAQDTVQTANKVEDEARAAFHDAEANTRSG